MTSPFTHLPFLNGVPLAFLNSVPLATTAQKFSTGLYSAAQMQRSTGSVLFFKREFVLFDVM